MLWFVSSAIYTATQVLRCPFNIVAIFQANNLILFSVYIVVRIEMSNKTLVLQKCGNKKSRTTFPHYDDRGSGKLLLKEWDKGDLKGPKVQWAHKDVWCEKRVYISIQWGSYSCVWLLQDSPFSYWILTSYQYDWTSLSGGSVLCSMLLSKAHFLFHSLIYFTEGCKTVQDRPGENCSFQYKSGGPLLVHIFMTIQSVFSTEPALKQFVFSKRDNFTLDTETSFHLSHLLHKSIKKLSELQFKD